MSEKDGRFGPGLTPPNWVPIGTVRIRTRHKRGGEKRAFVKVAEPSVWVLRAHVAWEAARGPIPRGMLVHHKDGDKLNDSIENLGLETRASHLDEHREGFDNERRIAAFTKARRARRWTTKSATKRTGRPRAWTDEELEGALAACRVGESAYSVSKRWGISRTTLREKLRATS